MAGSRSSDSQSDQRLDRPGCHTSADGRPAGQWQSKRQSQTCSTCGVKDGPKPLHMREWTCTACGTVHDRDTNAAINVKQAAGLVASACGAPVRPGAIPAQREETGSHGFPTGHRAA